VPTTFSIPNQAVLATAKNTERNGDVIVALKLESQIGTLEQSNTDWNVWEGKRCH
jgi:hypothetical protein